MTEVKKKIISTKKVVSRDWLIYSPSTGMVYCFACKMQSLQQNAFTFGYSDLKHLERVSAHESASHRESMLAILRRSRNVVTVDALLGEQRDDVLKY